jgi:hypothetical protein
MPLNGAVERQVLAAARRLDGAPRARALWRQHPVRTDGMCK